jgi:hypothetical protein
MTVLRFKMNYDAVTSCDGGHVGLSVSDDVCCMVVIAECGEAWMDAGQCLDLAQKLMLVAERLQEE